jgi:hypothetical protein
VRHTILLVKQVKYQEIEKKNEDGLEILQVEILPESTEYPISLDIIYEQLP